MRKWIILAMRLALFVLETRVSIHILSSLDNNIALPLFDTLKRVLPTEFQDLKASQYTSLESIIIVAMTDHAERENADSESNNIKSETNAAETLTDQPKVQTHTDELALRPPPTSTEQQIFSPPISSPAAALLTPLRLNLSLSIPASGDEPETSSPPSSLFVQSLTSPPPHSESPQEVGAQHLRLSRFQLLMRNQPLSPFTPNKLQHDLLSSRIDDFTGELKGSSETLNPSPDQRKAACASNRPIWLDPIRTRLQRLLQRKRVGHPNRETSKSPMDYLNGKFSRNHRDRIWDLQARRRAEESAARSQQMRAIDQQVAGGWEYDFDDDGEYEEEDEERPKLLAEAIEQNFVDEEYEEEDEERAKLLEQAEHDAQQEEAAAAAAMGAGRDKTTSMFSNRNEDKSEAKDENEDEGRGYANRQKNPRNWKKRRSSLIPRFTGHTWSLDTPTAWLMLRGRYLQLWGVTRIPRLLRGNARSTTTVIKTNTASSAASASTLVAPAAPLEVAGPADSTLPPSPSPKPHPQSLAHSTSLCDPSRSTAIPRYTGMYSGLARPADGLAGSITRKHDVRTAGGRIPRQIKQKMA